MRARRVLSPVVAQRLFIAPTEKDYYGSEIS